MQLLGSTGMTFRMKKPPACRVTSGAMFCNGTTAHRKYFLGGSDHFDEDEDKLVSAPYAGGAGHMIRTREPTRCARSEGIGWYFSQPMVHIFVASVSHRRGMSWQ